MSPSYRLFTTHPHSSKAPTHALSALPSSQKPTGGQAAGRAREEAEEGGPCRSGSGIQLQLLRLSPRETESIGRDGWRQRAGGGHGRPTMHAAFGGWSHPHPDPPTRKLGMDSSCQVIDHIQAGHHGCSSIWGLGEWIKTASLRGRMPETERGTRSEHDAKAWHCDVCGTVNHPKQCLIFDIPKFKCSGSDCHKEFDGDFDFCLGDVRVNGNLLLEKVITQEGDTCLTAAICHTLHMMHVVDSVVKDQVINGFKMNLDPTDLSKQYNALFPSEDAVPRSLRSTHKLVNISLMLKNKGVKLPNKDFYKIGDVRLIPGDNFEAICEVLAEGNPLITSFHPGTGFLMGLKYCQVYRAPLITEVKMEQDRGEAVDAHMVVLIGAFSVDGIRGFYFLNSHGNAFCARIITEELQVGRPQPVSGGIGKVQEKFNHMSAILFVREGEDAGLEFERLGEEADPNTVSMANINLLYGELIPRVEASEEHEVRQRREQVMAQMEAEAEEQRLKEEEEERQAHQLGQLGM